MKKESKKSLKKRVSNILDALDKEYGTDGPITLNHENGWELLVATILSAQCTDKRVNMITPGLFKKYPDVYSFARAKTEELEKEIFSTGFYHHKAENIIACAKKLISKYGASLPDTLDELIDLPGVGRKTANVILGHIFNKPAIVVDTHVKRISRLLKLTDTNDPKKAEYELMEILPQDHWIVWNTDLINLGRTICIARKPKCGKCILKNYCPSNKEQNP